MFAQVFFGEIQNRQIEFQVMQNHMFMVHMFHIKDGDFTERNRTKWNAMLHCSFLGCFYDKKNMLTRHVMVVGKSWIRVAYFGSTPHPVTVGSEGLYGIP